MNSNLKTREAVVKFLKDEGVDFDNDNLSDDDAIKVSELMELVDSMQKIKEEAKKNAENLRKEGVLSEKETKGYAKLKIERLKNEKLKSLEQPKNIPDGYKLKNVIGDGNCFYRAIAHIVSGDENNYLSIRNSAAKIASNLEEEVKGLKATYGIDDDSKLEDLDKGVLNYALGNIPFVNIVRQGFGYAKNGTIETIGDALYVLRRIKESLSKDCKEGGEAELYFISVAIGKPVVIYDNNGNVTGYSPTLSPILGRFLDKEDISMLGNDKVIVHHKGDHYQALVIAKKDQKNIISNSDKSFVEINNKEKNTEGQKNVENPNNSIIKNPSSKGIRVILRKPNDIQSKEKNSRKKVTFDLFKNGIKYFSKEESPMAITFKV